MKVEREIEELQAQLDELAERLADLSEGPSEKLLRTYDTVKDYAKRAQEEVGKSAKKVDSIAHDNPWHFVAGAVIVGFLAGMFLSRRD